MWCACYFTRSSCQEAQVRIMSCLLFLFYLKQVSAALPGEVGPQSFPSHLVDLSLERFEIELQKLLERVVLVRIQRVAQLRRGLWYGPFSRQWGANHVELRHTLVASWIKNPERDYGQTATAGVAGDVEVGADSTLTLGCSNRRKTCVGRNDLSIPLVGALYRHHLFSVYFVVLGEWILESFNFSLIMKHRRFCRDILLSLRLVLVRSSYVLHRLQQKHPPSTPTSRYQANRPALSPFMSVRRWCSCWRR